MFGIEKFKYFLGRIRDEYYNLVEIEIIGLCFSYQN